MTVYKWSQIANLDATADSNINWQEGQAPSSINDSARNMMAATAKWRDDITGIVATTGSGTAYLISSNQVFASNGEGYTVQFTPGTTNTGAVTLSVDGNTARPLRFLTGVDLPAGVLISGSLYQATYRNATSEWLLHSSPLAQPYLVPIGAFLDYGGTTAPNSNFVIPTGQTLNTTTYAVLFTIFGTIYNTGGESAGTFRIPDLTGRVVAMKEATATRLTSTYFGGNSTALGALGGSESHLLTTAEIPAHTHPNTLNDLGHTHTWGPSGNQANVAGTGASGTTPQYGSTLNSTGSNSGAPMSITNATNTGGGGAHTIVQPTIILNKILRVL